MTALIFTTPRFGNQRAQLRDGKTTVGRVPGNGLIIQDDTISAMHCEILVYGREVIIRDQGSTNGTWVGGCRVKGQTSVMHGQRIRFGSVEARLELPPPPLCPEHTEVTAIHWLAHHRGQLAVQEPAEPGIIAPIEE